MCINRQRCTSKLVSQIHFLLSPIFLIGHLDMGKFRRDLGSPPCNHQNEQKVTCKELMTSRIFQVVRYPLANSKQNSTSKTFICSNLTDPDIKPRIIHLKPKRPRISCLWKNARFRFPNISRVIISKSSRKSCLVLLLNNQIELTHWNA